MRGGNTSGTKVNTSMKGIHLREEGGREGGIHLQEIICVQIQEKLLFMSKKGYI